MAWFQFSPLYFLCIKNSNCMQFTWVLRHLHSRASFLLHFNITFVFRFTNLLKFYKLARNLSSPLSKWQHQLVSLVRTELCQNNTPWKTLRTQEAVTMGWCRGISPVKLLLYETQKMELITSQRGRNLIAEFPILSLAEIWNNNPHQGQAMSVNFPIHWTMAQSRPSRSIEQHQGTQCNRISQRDLSLLKMFSNMIPCYLHYHTGSSSQVGAEAMGF